MSSIVQKAPNLKILNLSGNEVSIETGMHCVWERQAEGEEDLPGGGKRQKKEFRR